jgi:hypothetical protein
LGIAVDATGNAYVTGRTASDETTFPVAVGPDVSHNGHLDAFVAKVSPPGTWLVCAGYIGGAGQDQGFGIAVLGDDAYVTGQAHSDHTTFPAGGRPGLDL